MRRLFDLGLVELVGTRQRRGATEHVYRAMDPPRRNGRSWEALGPTDKQRLLSAMLQQIAESTGCAAAAGGFDRRDAHITRTALKLDDQGWSALAQATKRWMKEVQRIECAAEERLGRHEPEAVLDVGLVVMLFEAQPFSNRRLSDGHPAARSNGITRSKPATEAEARRTR